MATNARSKSRGMRCDSPRWNAFGRATNGSCGPVTEMPLLRMVSTCSAHGSTSVTSWRNLDRNDPMYLPMAPAPTNKTFLAMRPSFVVRAAGGRGAGAPPAEARLRFRCCARRRPSRGWGPAGRGAPTIPMLCAPQAVAGLGPRRPRRAYDSDFECRALSRVRASEARGSREGAGPGRRAPVPPRGFELEERRESAAAARELSGRAFLDDHATLEHDHAVGLGRGREPVRHRQHGAPGWQHRAPQRRAKRG